VKQEKTMRRIFVGLVFVLVPLSVYSQEVTHKWVKSATDQTTVGLYQCIDQNSIVKLADGRIQFQTATSLNDAQTCEGERESDISVTNLDCNGDMSGDTAIDKEQPFRKDGIYNWTDRKDGPILIYNSMQGQTDRFVCHKASSFSQAGTHNFSNNAGGERHQ
jgi:hypothetical protein